MPWLHFTGEVDNIKFLLWNCHISVQPVFNTQTRYTRYTWSLVELSKKIKGELGIQCIITERKEMAATMALTGRESHRYSTSLFPDSKPDSKETHGHPPGNYMQSDCSRRWNHVNRQLKFFIFNIYVRLRDGRISTHADPTSTRCAISWPAHL